MVLREAADVQQNVCTKMFHSRITDRKYNLASRLNSHGEINPNNDTDIRV